MCHPSSDSCAICDIGRRVKKNHAIQITCSEKRNSLIGKKEYKSIMENDINRFPRSVYKSFSKLVYHILHTYLIFELILNQFDS